MPILAKDQSVVAVDTVDDTLSLFQKLRKLPKLPRLRDVHLASSFLYLGDRVLPASIPIPPSSLPVLVQRVHRSQCLPRAELGFLLIAILGTVEVKAWLLAAILEVQFRL